MSVCFITRQIGKSLSKQDHPAGVDPVRVLGSGPSLNFGCEGPQCIGPQENPTKTKFFVHKIVGIYNNRSGKSCFLYGRLLFGHGSLIGRLSE